MLSVSLVAVEGCFALGTQANFFVSVTAVTPLSGAIATLNMVGKHTSHDDLVRVTTLYKAGHNYTEISDLVYTLKL